MDIALRPEQEFRFMVEAAQIEKLLRRVKAAPRTRRIPVVMNLPPVPSAKMLGA
jgi:hypothetical protein